MVDELQRVLIVDDDDGIREILHEHLSNAYCCVATGSARDALALMSLDPFDLIMTDIAMPAMTGLEMLPHVGKLAPDSVTVMISGQRTIDYAIDAMRAGAFDYISKPFDLSEVNDVVCRALAHGRRLRDGRDRARTLQDRATAVREALKRQEFIVYYQPQIEINSRKLVGAEALVRWQHPGLGLLAPDDFISLAEESGTIVEIGALVLRTACAQTRQWQESGRSDFRVAVNVSPRQLLEANFVETVTEALSETKLQPEFLELEVTENSLMQNPDLAIKTLTKLRETGARIAIDDFGTGFSSLSYLKRLPLDSVKLDRSFVKDATIDPDDAALVMAIITLAHTLRLKVIAEGIEREDQLAFLRLMRCDEGRGYLVGRPAPSASITARLSCAENFVSEVPTQPSLLTYAVA